MPDMQLSCEILIRYPELAMYKEFQLITYFKHDYCETLFSQGIPSRYNISFGLPLATHTSQLKLALFLTSKISCFNSFTVYVLSTETTPSHKVIRGNTGIKWVKIISLKLKGLINGVNNRTDTGDKSVSIKSLILRCWASKTPIGW